MKEKIKRAKNVAIISVSRAKNLIMSFSEEEAQPINWIMSASQSNYKEEITVSKGTYSAANLALPQKDFIKLLVLGIFGAGVHSVEMAEFFCLSDFT